MKHTFKSLLSALLVLILASACQSGASEKKSENKDAVNESTPAENIESNATEANTVEVVFNANLATKEDLNQLGLSADFVNEILEKRPFLSMLDFDAIVPDSAKEELYKQLFVPMNLNTTEESDFKMIPGVGDRMAHEFEEYRPYTSILQFRKEIGKYVDDEEISRYENYLFVPVELNTASEEDIKALPGVGDRMAHEFEEYRPYSNMEQFNQEIGKYVDDKELSRLARFVYLKD